MSDQIQPAATTVGNTSKAQENRESPPLSTNLTTSATTLSLDGEPPFVITTEYVCNASKPLRALVSLHDHHGNGTVFRDPARRLSSGRMRRIGPTSTLYCDEDPEDHTELVRLEPGERLSTSYTVSVVPARHGIMTTDTQYMVAGNPYHISLKSRSWKWMYEDEVGEGLSREEWVEILNKQVPVDLEVDCEVIVTAT